MEFPAVGCARCGRDWLSLRTRASQTNGPGSGADSATQRISPRDNAKRQFQLGRAYAIVTGVLLLTIFVSGWCWSNQNVYGSSEGLNMACVLIWALAGGLLALSQVVFIVAAVRTCGSSARITVLLVAILMLALIGLFVFALTRMPS